MQIKHAPHSRSKTINWGSWYNQIGNKLLPRRKRIASKSAVKHNRASIGFEHMQYWRLRNNTKEFKILVDKGNIYGPQELLDLDGGSQIDESQLTFSVDDERNLPVSDFIPGPLATLIAKPYIFDVFDTELSKIETKFYTARTDIGDLLLLSIKTELSGFDFIRSSFESYEDDEIHRIFEMRLVEGFKTDLDIFRLKDDWGPRFEIVVSDNFKNKYEFNNFTGLIFAPV